jgi:NADH-quinone oxidoreductase subunit M
MVFIGLIVFTGLFPKPMLNRIEPSVDKLVEHVELRSDYKAPVHKDGHSTDSDTSHEEGK